MAEEYRVSQLSSLQIKKSTYLAILVSWRYSQGIYHFSSAFYKKLVHSFRNKTIDEENFHALPEWTIYVETPDLFWNKKPLEGFWVYLSWDMDKKETRLNLLLNNTNRLKLISLPLVSLHKIRPNSQNNSNLFLLILLVHYVCCHYQDFYSKEYLGHHPQKQKPRLYKGEMRLYPNSHQKIWQLHQ